MSGLVTIQSAHFPPSTNNLFATVAGGRRIRSKRYNEWANAAGWDCNGKGSVPGPFVISIIVSRKHRRPNADIDNRTKAILDLLVTHKVIEDDKHCERLSIEWGDCEGFYCEIRPYFRPL